MKITDDETLQEFISNHLDVQDFGFLVIANDDSLNHQALSLIRSKLKAFLEGENDER